MTERAAHGFTLIEILAAVFLLSILLVFAYQAQNLIQRSYQAASANKGRERAARIALDRIERELVGTVMIEREPESDPLLHPYVFYGKMNAWSDSEGDTLRFVTQTPLRFPGAPPQGLRLVSYGAAPAQVGPGLSILREELALPRQLEKEPGWLDAQVVIENVAQFVVRYSTEQAPGAEVWDSTGLEQLDQLPDAVVVSLSLFETAPDGSASVTQEYLRTISLPVRPFRLSGDDAVAGQADCGDGVAVAECLASYEDEIGEATVALRDAIEDARAQTSDQCWNSPQPSPGLQRLKVLLSGVPGWNAAACE